MNKTELKNFAINARLELLSRVRDRAALFGLTEEKCKAGAVVPAESFLKVDGTLLSNKETLQRKALEERIRNNGFVQVMEGAAYTWFNRLIALRYMEVHNLLPLDVRVIPEKPGDLPQIVREAQNAAIDGIDLAVVLQYLDENRSEELYKYLIIALCNNLSAWLPQMFEKINDYTELLFPDGLLKADSFLGMLAGVSEDNWQDIQVIGWLYQYYNTELKDETFALLKKNVKITKDRIGAATQLFTPEWIVRYMVENSLSRLWYEGHPDDSLKMKWRYYLDEAKQEPEVEAQLAEIREERKKLKLEEIKLLDPCMGSGHILVYAFDVLMQIYRSAGYTDRDAVRSIIENNLYGLDIDDRAAQLAYFALMMKAAEYDKRFLKRGIQPNVCAIQESNTLSEFTALRGQMSLDSVCISTANQLIEAFVDAKEYGSILTPKVENLASVNQLMEQLENAAVTDLEVSAWFEKARGLLPQLAEQTVIMQRKYHVVVTNPPYMGINNASDKLNSYAKTHYPVSKADLSTIFMEKTIQMCNETGLMSMINIPVWMSKSSFEQFRYMLLNRHTFINMLHNGRGIFGSDFGTTSFVIMKAHLEKYAAVFHQLFDEMGAVDSVEQKEKWFFERKGRYVSEQRRFKKIASYPIAYSTSGKLLRILDEEKPLEAYAYPRKGLTTGDNETFVRLWYEVDSTKFSMVSNGQKWFPMTKGGDFRRWYGNNEYVVNWENNGYEIKNFKDENGKLRSRPQNVQFYFREGISWNDTTATGKIAFRYQPPGYISNASGPCVFADNDLLYLFGLLNSIVSQKLLEILAPNMKFEVGQMALVPIIMQPSERIDVLVNDFIHIAKDDWDSFETSWDFQVHPLIAVRNVIASGQFAEARMRDANKLERCFAEWQDQCEMRFYLLKKNEEELNRIFIEIYGLQEELTPEVADKDVTVRKADLERDIRSLISYAVGCMFGRYSLDVPGLAYAGGEWNASKYVTYLADRDGILPITDDEYFRDDIVSMFVRWVKMVYGEETLEENLQFIANALNPTGGSAREVIRSYFMNDFFADHLRVYQKRPIYWQFDSGKQNGFKALIYLHRYDQDTVARLRTDYVHELQDRYRTQLDDARKTAESGDARQRAVANKRAQKLDKQLTELNKYEELVHHYADMRIPLDLDDGVKVNYAKFQAILTPVK